MWYGVSPDHMGEEAFADVVAALTDPSTVHAMCEDYRAGLGLDREADDRDRAAGHRISCPTLLGYSTGDDLEKLYGDPLAIWRNWAESVRAVTVESGHHMAEEAPEALAQELNAFLRTR
jgi:haloacetate dehalogenase